MTLTPSQLQALRSTCTDVRQRNLSSKRGHPKYCASMSSEEERQITDGCLALLDQLAAVEKERSVLRECWEDAQRVGNQRLTELSAVKAPADNVWFWQGRGDHPESLSCPVVMTADTLREFTLRIAALEKQVEEMRVENERWMGLHYRFRTGTHAAVAGLDNDARAHMGVACRNTESACFCGMHISQCDDAANAWRKGGEK